MAGSPARVADEGANDQEQEQTTAAPTTMASRMHTSERGLRHSPAVRSSARRSPADFSSMHDYTDTSEPQHGAEHGLSTEASAKTFDTEERDGDDLMDGNLAVSIQLGWGECRTPPPPASRSTHARA